MTETCFFYYGTIMPIYELATRMYNTPHLRQDIYCYINDFNLNYRRVGNVRVIYRIIVGKELKVFLNTNPYKLDKYNPYIKMDEKDKQRYKLSSAEELEIRNNLIKAGCLQLPDYWCIHNFLLSAEELKEMKDQYVQRQLAKLKK